MRGDLREEAAGVAFGHGIEGVGPIGDEAGEDVEAADRALRVGEAADAGRQVEPLLQGDDVDAAPLEEGRGGEVHFLKGEASDAFFHRRAAPGQETGANAVGLRPQPQVEAGRLQLILGEGRGRADDSRLGELREFLNGDQTARGLLIGLVDIGFSGFRHDVR